LGLVIFDGSLYFNQMRILIYFWIFLFGLAIGSFLNCFIYREKQKKSLKGSSFCPNCKHKLSVFDLVPVFSYILLRGRCRYCKDKISLQYPAVEIFTALLFLAIFHLFYPLSGILEVFIFLLVLFCFSSLMFIFVYDLKHYIIPNKIIYPAILAALIFVFLKAFFYEGLDLLINHLLSAVFTFSFFFLIYYFTRGRGLGFGDVRYAFFMGLFLGYPFVVVGLFFSFVIGAIIGTSLIVLKVKGRRDMIPFGPFLVLGTFIAFFWGDIIINWYLSLIL